MCCMTKGSECSELSAPPVSKSIAVTGVKSPVWWWASHSLRSARTPALSLKGVWVVAIKSYRFAFGEI